MPAKTLKQQRLMALAYISPQKVKRENRGVLRMGRGKLKDFMHMRPGKNTRNLRNTTRKSRRYSVTTKLKT